MRTSNTLLLGTYIKHDIGNTIIKYFFNFNKINFDNEN